MPGVQLMFKMQMRQFTNKVYKPFNAMELRFLTHDLKGLQKTLRYDIENTNYRLNFDKYMWYAYNQDVRQILQLLF